MTVAEIKQIIDANIYTNNSQFITALVLNPVLDAMVDQINGLVGDLANLETADTTNIVAAINEIKSELSQVILTGVILADGSVPFTAPQTVVEPTEGQHAINRDFLLSRVNTYQKAQGFGVVNKPYSPTMDWSVDFEQVAQTLAISGDMVIRNPTGALAGFTSLYLISQDENGGWDVDFEDQYKVVGEIDHSPNALNLLSVYHVSPTKHFAVWKNDVSEFPNITIQQDGVLIGQKPNLNLIAGDNVNILTQLNEAESRIDVTLSVASGSALWGAITGDILDQNDLMDLFDTKYDASNPAGFITDSALVPLENRITENEADILALQSAATENVIQSIIIACSDEDSDLELSTTEFRIPYAFTLTDVRASVGTAPTGSEIIVDINQNGTSILSTKLTIDDGEKISTTAEVPPVISTAALGDFNEITVDIDQIGSTVAGAGLKVYLIGYKTP